ncbi:MAG: hypothetical protein AAF628_03160 [Planctomycetota bacterium]
MKCRAHLYDYKKGGDGGLVKCLVDRIVKDSTAGDRRCPKCQQPGAKNSWVPSREKHCTPNGGSRCSSTPLPAAHNAL